MFYKHNFRKNLLISFTSFPCRHGKTYSFHHTVPEPTLIPTMPETAPNGLLASLKVTDMFFLAIKHSFHRNIGSKSNFALFLNKSFSKMVDLAKIAFFLQDPPTCKFSQEAKKHSTTKSFEPWLDIQYKSSIPGALWKKSKSLVSRSPNVRIRLKNFMHFS